MAINGFISRSHALQSLKCGDLIQIRRRSSASKLLTETMIFLRFVDANVSVINMDYRIFSNLSGFDIKNHSIYMQVYVKSSVNNISVCWDSIYHITKILEI